MKWKIFACTSLLVPVLGFGQTKSGGSPTDRPRSSYDPAAASGVRQDRPGAISSALAKINPGDKDYGAAVSEGRISVIEETVEDFYWWSCMVLTVLLMIATLYIVWLLRQRQLRLSISGDIVAQLYNSHVAARSKAFEAIEAHNQLVRRYNAQAAEIAALREAIEQKEGAPDAKQGIEAAEKLHSKGPKQKGEEPEATKAVSAPGVGPVPKDIQENASTDA
ncbi:MAG TPA: hypothetical protein VIX42_10685, partial [Edaphobacter sp.]